MISRISVKVGKVGKGQPHVNYIMGMGAYAKKCDEVKSFGVSNMPSLASTEPQEQAKEFFKAADKFERKNGSAYREHILSLPREFTLEQQQKVVANWIKKELKNLPTAWAIHHTLASDGQLQPHAHIMFSERQNDGINRPLEQFFKRYNAKNPEKGGAKKINTGMNYTERKAQLKAQRERWGETLKEHCKEFGFGELIPQIDMRNHKEKDKPKPVNVPMHIIQEFERKGYVEYHYDDEEDEETNTIVTLPAMVWAKDGQAKLALDQDKKKDYEVPFLFDYDASKNRVARVYQSENKHKNLWLLKSIKWLQEQLPILMKSVLSYPTFGEYMSSYWRVTDRMPMIDKQTTQTIDAIRTHANTRQNTRTQSNDFNR